MSARDAPIPDVLSGPSPGIVARRRFWLGAALGFALGALFAWLAVVVVAPRGGPVGETPADAPVSFVASIKPHEPVASATLNASVLDATDCDLSRALASAVAEAPPETPIRFRVTLLRVVDGDTIRVRWHDDNCAVRLVGIDAPERNQPGHREAADTLAALLDAAEAVYLTFPANHPRRDSFGRLLATVWADGIDCNAALLESGYAHPYARPRNR